MTISRRALLTAATGPLLLRAGGLVTAELLYGADFVASVVARFHKAGLVPEPAEVFRFPPLQGDPPLTVSGDVAALTNDSPAGLELITWLARPFAFDAWIKLGGFLSPNVTIPLDTYPTALSRDLAHQLRTSTNIHTDLSDLLGGRFGGGGSRGMFRILPRFFVKAASGGADARKAVARAQTELADAARRDVADGEDDRLCPSRPYGC